MTLSGFSEAPVLHLLNGEQYSGLERVVDHIVEAAPGYGYRVHLGYLKPDTMSGRMKSRNAVEHRIGMRNRTNLSVAHQAQAVAVAENCTLVHTHTVRGALIAAQLKWRTGLPWIHHMHSPALHETSRTARNLANFAAEAATLWNADVIVAVSQAMADYAAKFYRMRRSRIVVLPNGVATEPLPPSDETPPMGTTISVVGLFRPRKGITVLIDSLARLAQAGSQVRLRLVGEFSEPDYERQVRNQVEALGLAHHVDFVGFTGDVNAELDRCHIFVFPSLYGEGMPMAIMEAMAAGRPVIASDIDGIRELLSGGAGILVPAGQPGPLADAIAGLLKDPQGAKRLGSRGWERQRERHDVRKMCQSIFGLYGRVASHGAIELSVATRRVLRARR